MDTTFTVLSRTDFQTSFLYPNFQKGEGRIKKFSDIQGTQFLLLECMHAPAKQRRTSKEEEANRGVSTPGGGREVPESQQWGWPRGQSSGQVQEDKGLWRREARENVKQHPLSPQASGWGTYWWVYAKSESAFEENSVEVRIKWWKWCQI